MDPGTQLSLFAGAWRYPGMNPGLSGMDLSQVSQAAYRYNQNMMEYYTCKAVIGAQAGHQGAFYADGDNNIYYFLASFIQDSSPNKKVLMTLF